MKRTLKTADVLDLLKKEQGDKSLRQFAEHLGISAAYLSDVYRGNRQPGPALLEFLGLEKDVPEIPEPTYHTKESSAAD